MDTEKKRAFIINTLYLLIMIAAGAAVVKWLLPMLTPFVIGFVFAYILRRPTLFISKKLKLPEKPVALAMVLVFYCTVGLLLVLLAFRAVAGVRALIEMLPGFYVTRLEPAINDLFLKIEASVYQMDESLFQLIQDFGDQFIAWLSSSITKISGLAVGAASNLATAIPGLFIQLVLTIISTFFIAADYSILKKFVVRQLSPKSHQLLSQIKQYVVGTLFVCIGSYFIIATLTFVELSIGLSILGIRNAILVAALIAVFDILPVLGTGGIVIPWAVFSLIRGDFPLAIGLLILYVAITVIRNIVEPKIVGGQLGLHPVVTLASMFAGAQLFGVVGLFGFPIGLSLLRYLNDNGSISIFKTE